MYFSKNNYIFLWYVVYVSGAYVQGMEHAQELPVPNQLYLHEEFTKKPSFFIDLPEELIASILQLTDTPVQHCVWWNIEKELHTFSTLQPVYQLVRLRYLSKAYRDAFSFKKMRSIIRYWNNYDSKYGKDLLETLILNAVRNKRLSRERLKVLLALGARIDTTGNCNSYMDFHFKAGELPTSLIDIAINRDDLEALDALIFYGADIEGRGPAAETPLIVAVYMERSTCVKALLAAGADTTAVNIFGKNAARVARYKKHYDLARMIEQYDMSRGQKMHTFCKVYALPLWVLYATVIGIISSNYFLEIV